MLFTRTALLGVLMAAALSSTSLAERRPPDSAHARAHASCADIVRQAALSQSAPNAARMRPFLGRYHGCVRQKLRRP